MQLQKPIVLDCEVCAFDHGRLCVFPTAERHQKMLILLSPHTSCKPQTSCRPHQCHPRIAPAASRWACATRAAAAPIRGPTSRPAPPRAIGGFRCPSGRGFTAPARETQYVMSRPSGVGFSESIRTQNLIWSLEFGRLECNGPCTRLSMNGGFRNRRR